MNKWALVDDDTGNVVGVYTANEAPAAPEGKTFRSVTGAVPGGGGRGKVLRESGGALIWVGADPAAAWDAVREKRDALLRASDWRPVLAADRGGQAMAAWNNSPWRSYRQALRDVTEQPDPFNITWPTPPA